MNYYIKGDKERAEEIKAAFEKEGYDVTGFDMCDDNILFFTYELEGGGKVISTANVNLYTTNIIKTHPDYKELELPVEPKFKAEDRIVSKSDKSTIYRIITLHEERMEYIVEIEHKDYHESCPWIAFEDQDDYELAPKPHYDISNFHAGMPVLVRDTDGETWAYNYFSHIAKDERKWFNACGWHWNQCIPFNDDTKHLLGTTETCDECYVNW